VAALIVALAVTVGAISLFGGSGAGASQSTQIQYSQDMLANRQTLVAKTATNTAQHTRAVNCVKDETAILCALGACPSPSPSPSPSGTPSPSPTPTTPSPTPTSASPSPTVTTPPPTTTVPPTTTTPPSPTPTPSPTDTPPPPTSMDPAWWEANTGVPPFAILAAYTGPCTITTANAVIADVDTRTKCPNGLTIRAQGVLIQRSMLRNMVSPDDISPLPTVRAEQVDIDGGQSSSFPAVAYQGVTLVKANVHGGQHSLQCSGNCTAIDSWFHDTWLPDSSAAHENGIISNGGSGGLFRHNRIQCDHPGGNPSGGGCSGDASLFGDFGVISNWTFDQNLFMTTGGSYCTYAGHNPGKAFPNVDHIVYTNNVFEKAYPTNNGHQPGSPGCAYYGPVTGFDTSAPRNIWTANVFDTGGAVSPA